jgi:hypothetical protein
MGQNTSDRQVVETQNATLANRFLTGQMDVSAFSADN